MEGSSSASKSNGSVVVVEEGEGEGEEKRVGVEEGEGDEDGFAPGFVPGPLVSLKEQLEKDKDDESLRRWKEKLLGCVDGEFFDQMEPEVTFYSITVLSEGHNENITISTLTENQPRVLFTLKENSSYRLQLRFSVQHNIVSGLAYSNTVWKGGVRVDETKGMLGTFAPQQEIYVHTLEEETTPSGILARGIYSAKLKFEDDDKRCYLELNYQFEIKSK
ncbi:Rho GDP-dissociation inhibitor protein [Dioscorea alata]|uniref:Rho GDP-dissociation inhibitor protein n=1 Tax=Dioscorea alata TaxID=55571 RepID=A0ACB7WT85_DIOAL|nr:Rho GDP-dissociation inhibitor protein [Dioscorea alata]